MLSMVWHSVVLPGMHTVTVVYKVLTVDALALSGPASTVTATTFDAAAIVVTPEELGATVPPPPPPHDTVARLNSIASPPPNARLNLSINATHPETPRPGPLAANKPGR